MLAADKTTTTREFDDDGVNTCTYCRAKGVGCVYRQRWVEPDCLLKVLAGFKQLCSTNEVYEYIYTLIY